MKFQILCLLGFVVLVCGQNTHLKTYRKIAGTEAKLPVAPKAADPVAEVKQPAKVAEPIAEVKDAVPPADEVEEPVKVAEEPAVVDEPEVEAVIPRREDLGLHSLVAYIAELQHYINTLHERLNQKTVPTTSTAGSIAFNAIRTGNLGPVAQDTVVTFDLIDVNVGNNFQSNTAFYVPLDGLYYFTYKFSGTNVIVDLMMKPDDVSSGSVVQRSGVGDGSLSPSGGGAIVMDLVAGNQVYLRLEADDSGTPTIISDPTNRLISFSGFMLYQRV